MGADIDDPIHTTNDGRAVIEQRRVPSCYLQIKLSPIIDELRACYDYCAAWREPTQERDRALVTEAQP